MNDQSNYTIALRTNVSAEESAWDIPDTIGLLILQGMILVEDIS